MKVPKMSGIVKGAIISELEEDDQEEAEQELKKAQKEGINKSIWHIDVGEQPNFPEQHKNFLYRALGIRSQYKEPSESYQDYLKTMIKEGTAKINNGYITLTNGNIRLKFKKIDEKSRKKILTKTFSGSTDDLTEFYRETHPGYDLLVDEPETVSGKVPTTYGHTMLKYEGWERAYENEKPSGEKTSAPNRLVMGKTPTRIKTERSKLERSVLEIIGIVSLAGGILFLSPNLTGNAIANINNSTSSFLGAGLLIIGCVLGFLRLKFKKQ